MNLLYWLANHNFFGKPTFIRKIQCDLFGHNWYCWSPRREPNKKNKIRPQGSSPWCGWCARETEDYPKMRKRKT